MGTRIASASQLSTYFSAPVAATAIETGNLPPRSSISGMYQHDDSRPWSQPGGMRYVCTFVSRGRVCMDTPCLGLLSLFGYQNHPWSLPPVTPLMPSGAAARMYVVQ